MIYYVLVYGNLLLSIGSVESSSVDGFPFVGAVPGRDGQFLASGFSGHGEYTHISTPNKTKLTFQGMPRILLSTAHVAPLALDAVGVEHSAPSLVQSYPAMPEPFHLTTERIDALANADPVAIFEKSKQAYNESAKKPFCNDARSLPRL